MRLISRYPIVYRHVANDYALWQLVKIFPKFSSKQIVKFDPKYLEMDADFYINLCFELYLKKNFEGMKEH